MRLLFTILLVTQLGAAEYYIDFVGGSDANNGTSDSTPWQHHPWDPNATGTSAATTPETTSTNYFKGGVAYGGQIRLRADGDATTPMLFTTKTGWGTGMAIFDPTNTLTFAFASRTSTGTDRFGKNHTFDGLEFYRIGGYAADSPVLTNDCTTPVTSPTGGVAILYDIGANNITVRNCYFHEVGQWRNQPPFSSTTGVTGIGVNLDGAKDCTVSSNYFTRMKNPIAIKGKSSYNSGLVSGITISSNYISGYTVWQLDIAAQSSSVTFSNIVISANTFNDNATFDQGNWLGCSDNPHSDMIFLRNSNSTADWKEVYIRNNRFFCDTPGSSSGGTAAIYLSQGPSATIEGNVFVAPPEAVAMVDVFYNPLISLSATQTVVLRNNTFFGASRSLMVDSNTLTNRYRSVSIYNNLLVRPTSGIYECFQLVGTNDYSIVSVFNNAYSKIVQPDTAVVVFYVSATKTLAEFQALGFDSNSIYTTDPLLACGTSVPAVPSTGNYQPISGSPLIGAGFYSADIPPDINGTTRANPPAIGAYEYAGAAPNAPEITTHPVSQIVVNGASADLLVVATGDAPLTYQWYAGFSGDTSAPIANATNSVYTATYTASAVRWVQVTNGSGSADSTTATVTVVAVETGTTSASRRRRR